jgi:glutamyl-tRNA synthetase
VTSSPAASPVTGRFAPSPTGSLHLGNLRTALLAWLFARSVGGRFLMRVEDLDTGRVRRGFEEEQVADLRALGLDWNGPVVRQSERLDLYSGAIADLHELDLLYECFCTRAEIRRAASAPHGALPEGAYPGTCRELTRADRDQLRAAGRRPALRVRAEQAMVGFEDRLLGARSGQLDDFVVRRGDGIPAYNLAVVVDDAAQGVTEVVRGADLAETTPRQVLLTRLLDLPIPSYAHVPLVLGADGARLAKRHGAVTLAQRAARGEGPRQTLAFLAETLGLSEPGESPGPYDLLERFDPDRLPRGPTRLPAEDSLPAAAAG